MTQLAKYKLCELLKAYELIGNEIYKQWEGKVPTGESRPPKEWWDNCIARAEKFASDPEKYCGALYFHGPKNMKESFGKGGVEKMSKIEKEKDKEDEDTTEDEVVETNDKNNDEVANDKEQNDNEQTEEEQTDEEEKKMDDEVTPSTQADVLQQILEAIRQLQTMMGSGNATTEPQNEAGTGDEVAMSDVSKVDISKAVETAVKKQLETMGITKTETPKKPTDEVKKESYEILKTEELAKMTWQEVEDYVDKMRENHRSYW